MSTRTLAVLLLLLVQISPARADRPGHSRKLAQVNRRICGQVVDHTHNHGADRRIWSCALQEKRDLYVYLPPGFDPSKQYPLMIWLHGFAADDEQFLAEIVEPIDRYIAQGKLPPIIIAAPDGALTGHPSLLRVGSFFLNTKAGRFEDYLMVDVWNFLHTHYPIRPERDAHVIAGVSMGGGAAYNKAFKYRDQFKNVLGIFPPLNTRWEDCHGRYKGNFSPDCWGWRTTWNRRFEVVARYYGVFTIRVGQVIRPLYGKMPAEELLANISAENPIEVMERCDVQPGELNMFIAYAGKDEFNIDAQVESFLCLAKQRGLCPTVAYNARGHHDVPTALGFFDVSVHWLNQVLAPYATPVAAPCAAPTPAP